MSNHACMLASHSNHAAPHAHRSWWCQRMAASPRQATSRTPATAPMMRATSCLKPGGMLSTSAATKVASAAQSEEAPLWLTAAALGCRAPCRGTPLRVPRVAGAGPCSSWAGATVQRCWTRAHQSRCACWKLRKKGVMCRAGPGATVCCTGTGRVLHETGVLQPKCCCVCCMSDIRAHTQWWPGGPFLQH